MDIFYLGYLKKQFVSYLHNKLGAPEDQIILVSTIISASLFTFVNYFIKGKTPRLIYNLVVGLILHYSLYGINSLHNIFSTVTSYLFVYFFGRKLSPFYLLIATMIHLSYLNIYIMIVDYGGWTIDDVSTTYMMAVTKFSAFAFSYDDGKKDIKDIRSEYHRNYRIEKMPSFLEYAAYIFFYPTCLVGPSIQYMDFINWVEEKGCYKNLKSKRGYLFWNGLTRLLAGFFFIAFYTIIGAKFPMAAVGRAQFRIDYPEWWQRFLYMYIAGPVARSKYYIGWLLSYSSLIFSGMAYGETVEKDKIIPNVEKGSYGSIMFNEFGMDPQKKMVHWNRQVHLWLKYNVYTRLLTPLKGKKALATFITYVFSSIWHGFYPSYYINFFFIFLFEQDSIFLSELGFYKYVDEHKILWPFISLKTSFFNNSVGAFFYCLESGSAKQILINYYGLPANVTIAFYIFVIVCRLFFMKKKKRPIEKGNKEIKENINNRNKKIE